MEAELRLRPLRMHDESAALLADAQLAEDNFSFLLGRDERESWDAYIQKLKDRTEGRNTVPNWVPSTFLVATVDNQIVGRISLRHELNEYLFNYGGHIGYAVLKKYRGRGYATEILRQGLILARAKDIDSVLVTCDDHNIASARVIEKCGGIYENTVSDASDSTQKRRYWIN